MRDEKMIVSLMLMKNHIESENSRLKNLLYSERVKISKHKTTEKIAPRNIFREATTHQTLIVPSILAICEICISDNSSIQKGGYYADEIQNAVRKRGNDNKKAEGLEAVTGREISNNAIQGWLSGGVSADLWKGGGQCLRNQTAAEPTAVSKREAIAQSEHLRLRVASVTPRLTPSARSMEGKTVEALSERERRFKPSFKKPDGQRGKSAGAEVWESSEKNFQEEESLFLKEVTPLP